MSDVNRVAVIALCGSPFEDLFWGSYLRCTADYPHDFILVHRDELGLPKEIPDSVILENKIINGVDVPHRAYGAYQYYFNKYQHDYDLFVFISDDVVLKRDGWLKDIVHTMNKHEKIGFGASHIFSHKGYPHPNHCRSIFWWAKTEALQSIRWKFDHDHDGEMKTGDLLSDAGWIGVQVGNKINLGYDVLEPNHIIAMVEKEFSPQTFPFGKIEIDHFQCFIDALRSGHPDPFHCNPLFNDYSLCVWCDDPGIYSRNVFTELFCFDQLVYSGKSEETARDCGIADQFIIDKVFGYDIHVLNV